MLNISLQDLSIFFNFWFLRIFFSDFVVKCLHLSNIEKGYDRYQCEDVIVNVSIDPKCVFFSISTANGVVQFRTIEKSNSKTCIAQFKACPPFSHIRYFNLILTMNNYYYSSVVNHQECKLCGHNVVIMFLFQQLEEFLL